MYKIWMCIVVLGRMLLVCSTLTDEKQDEADYETSLVKLAFFSMDEVNVTFDTFGETIQLRLYKFPHTTVPNIPVIVIDEDGMKTVQFNFTEHNVGFYEETDGLTTVTIQQLPGSLPCFSVDAILPRRDYYLIVEPEKTQKHKCLVGADNVLYIKSIVCRRWTISKKKTIENRQNQLLKRFLVDGIARQPDNVLPTRGKVDAKVEILAWTDHTYIESFTNLGSLMYQHAILDPSLKISLYLTGAIICKVPECSNFTSALQQNNSVDNYKALDKFSESLVNLFNNKTLTFHYDVGVAFTRYDLTDPNGTPVGVSNADDICKIESGESSAIIEDQGAYSCVGTLVHELAHVLGSDHDGFYRGKECDETNGFIMSPIAPLEKSAFFFSQCTVNSIKENLLNPNSSCVLNEPNINVKYEAMVDNFPGQILNTTEQCRQLYGTHFCLSTGTSLKDICHKMFCWDPYLKNVCSTKTAAAPYTSCGPKQWCLNGECVHDARAP